MFSIRNSRSRWAAGALALLGVMALGVATADARVGGGSSVGSRGGRTFAAPPATNTAPRATQPIQRSTTQPGVASAQAARPVATGSRFGSGFGGLLMGGLLGAGLFGLLSGAGLFGGMSGFAGFLGLLLQVALIGGLVWLAMSFFRSRQPAMAGAGAPMSRNGMLDGPQTRTNYGFGGGGGNGPSGTPLNIAPADFDAFERLLGRVQDAYGREDLATLRAVMTSEMANFMAEDIAANERKKQHNLVSDAKLLQGDLSEAWREADAEYATVAMRFSILDTMVERGTGRVISGDPSRPEEVTEVWTFVRRPGSNENGWKVSAIQQA